jgi:hypothetical protein
MPFTLTITTTKPANTIFFGQVSDINKAKRQLVNDWTALQPGFIPQTDQLIIDENTRQQILVWETEQDYINYNTNRANLPEQTERKSYNNLHGITSTIVTS